MGNGYVGWELFWPDRSYFGFLGVRWMKLSRVRFILMILELAVIRSESL